MASLVYIDSRYVIETSLMHYVRSVAIHKASLVYSIVSLVINVVHERWIYMLRNRWISR